MLRFDNIQFSKRPSDKTGAKTPHVLRGAHPDMKKLILTIGIFIFCALPVKAGTLAQDLSGKILLNVEGLGEAWYVNPTDLKRYYLGRPTDAFRIMRELGLGINEVDFQKIAQEGMPVAGDIAAAKRLSGRIILQVERNGEAWYVNPTDLKKYYLGRPADAFNIMRRLGLGITKNNLARVHKPGTAESIDQYSSYELETINTASGNYKIDIVTIDLRNSKLKIITDTANAGNCKTGCLAKELLDFSKSDKLFAAINGTYFCTSGSCSYNYYFYPVFNSQLKTLINDDQLKYWTTGPVMVFDENNKFYYFKDSREFKSVKDFENTYNTKIQAAIGNKPRLIENKMNLLIEWDIDDKQRKTKALRNAIAYKENPDNPGRGFLYLVVARNATVPELADIMKAMNVDYALNLDGGYSSALFYNGEYMVGPGRNIPNAILFAEK